MGISGFFQGFSDYFKDPYRIIGKISGTRSEGFLFECMVSFSKRDP